MPKLKPDTQRARREHILDAALTCFARGGFHATTMQAICREAGVSPGALYVYFDSKEALIAGLCERDRAEFAEPHGQVAVAALPGSPSGSLISPRHPIFSKRWPPSANTTSSMNRPTSSASSWRWGLNRRAIRASPTSS